MLQHLMEHGLKVDGGDRLGKTIIFAVNQQHAQFIARRFDHHYPHYKGAFARVITHSVNYAQSLIDDFSIVANRSEEHTSELQSLMRISYAVFCLKKKNRQNTNT